MADAIERARELLAAEVFDPEARADIMAFRPTMVSASIAEKAILAAFAQQAPEGWQTVPKVCPEAWLARAKKLLGADVGTSQIIWSAMLDASPSVGEGV